MIDPSLQPEASLTQRPDMCAVAGAAGDDLGHLSDAVVFSLAVSNPHEIVAVSIAATPT